MVYRISAWYYDPIKHVTGDNNGTYFWSGILNLLFQKKLLEKKKVTESTQYVLRVQSYKKKVTDITIEVSNRETRKNKL